MKDSIELESCRLSSGIVNLSLPLSAFVYDTCFGLTKTEMREVGYNYCTSLAPDNFFLNYLES